MITKLHLENFKGHRDTTIELPRFAMLVGDNGSGKTSVLEALLLPQRLLSEDDGARAAVESIRKSTTRMNLDFPMVSKRAAHWHSAGESSSGTCKSARTATIPCRVTTCR